MAQNRVITIDNGGSELRYISNTDDASKIFSLDKHISQITGENFRIKDNVDPLDIVEILSASNNSLIGMYATGNGYYMYNGIDVVMNNQKQKSGTIAWYQQIIIAIAMDAMHSLMNKHQSGFIDYGNDLDFNYSVGVLIPVSEHSGDDDNIRVVRENLSGTYRVTFPCVEERFNTIQFTINSKSIGILPEGVVAITNLANQVGKEEFTLVLDIGHVSTDIAICKGRRLVGSSVLSSSYAGGTLIKILESILRKYRVLLTQEQIIEVLNSYSLNIGTKKIDVAAEVMEAKHRFVVNFLKDEILKQIELVGISATNISYIIPIGGVLNIKDPYTGQKDIMNDIIKECNLVDAIVNVFDGDFRYININEAVKFTNKLKPGDEDESDIDSE